MLRYVVLCLTVLTAVSARFIYEFRSEWSPKYTVKGVFYLPLKDVQEPFEAWYDSQSKNMRVVYMTADYESTACVQVLPPSDSMPKGSLRKFFYEKAEEEEQLTLSCMEMDLQFARRDPPIENVLPDMVDYEFVGTEMLLDVEVSKWYKVVTEVGSRKEFSVWMKIDKGQRIPLKYEVNTYNTLLGTHDGHFYLEYNEYHTDFDMDIFHETYDMACSKSQYIELNPMDYNLFSVRSASEKRHFRRFMQIHGRWYANDSEHEERLAIFRKNVKFINEHNRGNSTYKMAVNHLADRTDDELSRMFGGFHSGSGVRKSLAFPYSSDELEESSTDFPEEFDWRPRGAVTPVKDQLSCGSCWSFGAVGVLEGAQFLHNNGTKPVVRLSEQALIDCAWSSGNSGCDGGWSLYAFEWVKKHGMPTYEAYGGYMGENGLCHIEAVKKTMFIKGWVQVKPNDENALKVAIFKHGPVSVAFYANIDTLRFYSSGVYYDPKCLKAPNHEVLAVGYGVLDGESYWIIKNSWGSSWGVNGYLLMATKDNNCGLMNYPTHVVI